MKITEERSDSLHLVSAYRPGCIRVNRTDHRGSLVLSPEGVREGWAGASIDALTVESLEPYLKPTCPELVLVGSGETLRFPQRAVLTWLQSRGVGIEVMDTAAACRTYNVLALEGRRVLALLINA